MALSSDHISNVYDDIVINMIKNDENNIDSKMTREELVLQLKDGFATSKTEGEQKCFQLEGWISIDCKGAVTGQMSSKPIGDENQKMISRYLSTVSANLLCAASGFLRIGHQGSSRAQNKTVVPTQESSRAQNKTVKNKRFGDISLLGALSVGQQSLQLELVKATTDSRAEALRTVVATIMRQGQDGSPDEYMCQGKLMANCAEWTFSHLDYDGPRYYRSVFESVNKSKLPVSLAGLVSSYLIPGFKMPTKSIHISQPDFTPTDLPVCLKLSKGKSTHLTTGQVFWEMFGELHVGTDLTVCGFINHRKPVVRVDHYANGFTFRNEIKSTLSIIDTNAVSDTGTVPPDNLCYMLTVLPLGSSTYGATLGWVVETCDRAVAFALLQNLTEVRREEEIYQAMVQPGTDWRWDFEKVDYEQKASTSAQKIRECFLTLTQIPEDDNHDVLSKRVEIDGQ
eukprot:jgi/Bigna1/84181/fgenesh1_pg.125_\